jgi:hypothetical protein
MNEHQRRLWRSMISLIQSYLNGKTDDFYGIVGELEGALDASEIKDVELINQWYDFWTPLEIRRAVEGNKVDKMQCSEDLENMKRFLLKNLCDDGSYYCRVCGLRQDFQPWGEHDKTPTFETCVCCGVNFGCEDCNKEFIWKFRDEWVKNGGNWTDLGKKPSNWSLEEQMKNIPEKYK